MEKEKYYSKLAGLRDKIDGSIKVMGICESLGAFTRNTIPQFKQIIPLDDIEIVELGEINQFTGEIKPINQIKHYTWQELYNFHITEKAVENEEQTSNTEDSDKQ